MSTETQLDYKIENPKPRSFIAVVGLMNNAGELIGKVRRFPRNTLESAQMAARQFIENQKIIDADDPEGE